MCIGSCIALSFIAAVSRSDALCNGIDSINRDEQRVFVPPKTQDVMISSSWNDLKAYRYDIKNLPETEVRTTCLKNMVWVYQNYRSFSFGLLPGGFVNFTYQIRNATVDIHLMTPTQYKNFKNKKPIESEWCSKNTSYVSHVFTAKEAGVYYIVVDAKYMRVSIITEKVNITTPAYKVSNDTAKEVCTMGCTFKKVHNNEIVILEYLGKDSDVYVNVWSGKGSFQKSFIFPILVSCALILFAGAGSVALIYNSVQMIKKSRQNKAVASATTETQNTPTVQNDTTPETTPETVILGTTNDNTPYTDPTAPLILSANNDDISYVYGTARPPPENA